MKNVWEETLPVRFGHVDMSGHLTPAAAFELFQEAAIRHAEDLGAGRAILQANRQGWILSRISVIAAARPRWKDTITVRSWPRGTDRLFAVRDYDIHGDDGSLLIRGRGGWLILDLDKRRPLRPRQIVAQMPLNDGLDALAESPPGLDAQPNLEKTAERTARYSDLDYNGHMNNVRYISWVQDIVKPGLLEDARRFRLDINYLAEVKLGELVELWSGAPARAGRETASGSPPPDDTSRSSPAWAEAIAVEGRRAGEPVFRAELRVQKT